MNCFLGLDALHVRGMLDSAEVDVAWSGDDEDKDEDSDEEEDEEQADDEAGDVNEEAAICDRDDDCGIVVVELELARFPSDIRRNSASWLPEDVATEVSLNNTCCSSNRAKSSSGSAIKSNRASSSSSGDCNNLSAASWSFFDGIVEVSAVSRPVLTGEHLWLASPEVDDWLTAGAVLLAWRRWRVK